ncbi:hypothetical protein BKP35_16325 [Anaerobacillus arseniciselenatis]|uniref:Uncharacterized protein n=1 Tax=Anaerobacillus arseniciselenatis TaxID=85682 RepID=A0A1S2LAZ5_9BACI|nr:hypothetical protein [Anaerobacillus arseniciselenatis]OIJ09420.1 hypothetical protein BKP35_16325 [Anaerobacillus arseniciselenatis]
MSKYKYEKKDFIYVIAICIITLIFVIGNFYWRTESSGTTLNNVATGISIVLAVVAIVITLVNVAGQRNGILEIKDTAEKLEALHRESYDLYQ